MSSTTRVTIDDAPLTLAAFLAAQRGLARTPHGAAVAMALALWAYADRREEGPALVAAAMDGAHLDGGGGPGQLPVATRQKLDGRIVDRPELLRAYVVGTTPEGGYVAPTGPLVFEVSENPHSGDEETGMLKVFLACSGADSPRPVTLRQAADGTWKAWEWSSLTLGVKGLD